MSEGAAIQVPALGPFLERAESLGARTIEDIVVYDRGIVQLHPGDLGILVDGGSFVGRLATRPVECLSQDEHSTAIGRLLGRPEFNSQSVCGLVTVAAIHLDVAATRCDPDGFPRRERLQRTAALCNQGVEDMSRRSRENDRIGHEYPSPLRFSVDAQRGIGYPPRNLEGTPSELRDWPTLALPPAEIIGADPDSLREVLESGDMTLIELPGGIEPYWHHQLVDDFAYELVPVPTLSFALRPQLPGQLPTAVRFVNATISDWTTDRNYEPTDPNNELCEFVWDGRQNFLLEFLSFKIIVQAATLEFCPLTDFAG